MIDHHFAQLSVPSRDNLDLTVLDLGDPAAGSLVMTCAGSTRDSFGELDPISVDRSRSFGPDVSPPMPFRERWAICFWSGVSAVDDLDADKPTVTSSERFSRETEERV